jgi:hypothetical protein
MNFNESHYRHGLQIRASGGWVLNPARDGKKQYYILPAARYENDTVLLYNQAQADLKVFMNDSR